MLEPELLKAHLQDLALNSRSRELRRQYAALQRIDRLERELRVARERVQGFRPAPQGA